MKKSLLLFCLFLIAFPENGFAQNDSVAVTRFQPLPFRNSVYLEIGGNGYVGSVNYERLVPLRNPRKTLALRVGAIIAPFSNSSGRYGYEMLLPVEASMLLGKRAVKLELGLGTTLYNRFNSEVDGTGERRSGGSSELIPALRVGGRWQNPGSRWFFRAGFTPFLKEFYYATTYSFTPWGGISVGYNFGKN